MHNFRRSGLSHSVPVGSGLSLSQIESAFVPSGKIDGTGKKITESILWVRGLDGCRWGADGVRMRRLRGHGADPYSGVSSMR